MRLLHYRRINRRRNITMLLFLSPLVVDDGGRGVVFEASQRLIRVQGLGVLSAIESLERTRLQEQGKD
jgi:hypothetical protein